MTKVKTLPFVLILLLLGCGKATTPTPPTPDPIQFASQVDSIASILSAATEELFAARRENKISLEDLDIAENVIIALSKAGKDINIILRSKDPWTVQKTKIVTTLINSGATEAAKRISPTARLILAASLTVFNQISSTVGEPTI